MSDRLNTLGWRLSQRRINSGMTQATLAKKAKLSVTFLSEVENNRRTPGTDSLVAIADALGVSLDYLVKGKQISDGPGIGMPAALYLDEFGSLCNDAFGGFGTYHVGSSLTHKRDWRDVDVRVILSDEEYAAMGFGDPEHPHQNPRWVSFVMAFAALGRQMTGLPIDFQIQQQTHANAKFPGARSALGCYANIRRFAERDRRATPPSETPETEA